MTGEFIVSKQHSFGSILGAFKGVSEFLGDALEAFKDVPFAKALEAASPWFEAAGDTLAAALPPVKFVLSLFEKLTAIPDPDELAALAYTLSDEHALAQAVATIGNPKLAQGDLRLSVRRLRDLGDKIPNTALDFSKITYDNLLAQPFLHWADELVRQTLTEIGYDETQCRDVVSDLHTRFVTHFKTLLSHGDSRERFTPLREKLTIGTSDSSALAALLDHAEYQRALFEERPVFGQEVFALAHVYTQTECGFLEWGAIRDSSSSSKNGLDPFQEQNGGRQNLGQTVLQLIGDPTFNDAIVVQGVAGSGKSAFTQWLSANLMRAGLRPIRILLRDIRLERNRPILEALSQAIRYDDDVAHNTIRQPRPDDPFNNGAIFKERIHFGNAYICPYVLVS